MSWLQRYDFLHWIADLLNKPPADVVARRSLEDAQRNLLEHEHNRDYHENMVVFYRKRIVSLQHHLRKNE